MTANPRAERIYQEAMRSTERLFEAIANYTYDWESWHAADGRLDRARVLYQEVHLLAPTTAQGQAAIDRLRRLDQPCLCGCHGRNSHCLQIFCAAAPSRVRSREQAAAQAGRL